jgi:hypothetical protein
MRRVISLSVAMLEHLSRRIQPKGASPFRRILCRRRYKIPQPLS